MMQTEPIKTDELREIGLFGALADDVLEHLAQTLKVVLPTTGDVLFREGDEPRDMFVVLRGELEVMKASPRGNQARIALLGPGNWFGDMSLLDMQPRSATVRVLAPSRVVRITSADLDALYRRDVKSYALIVQNLARELSRRLRVADGLLAGFVTTVMDSYMASGSRSHPG
jgi:CRP-like cAMP-binding protein